MELSRTLFSRDHNNGCRRRRSSRFWRSQLLLVGFLGVALERAISSKARRNRPSVQLAAAPDGGLFPPDLNPKMKASIPPIPLHPRSGQKNVDTNASPARVARFSCLSMLNKEIAKRCLFACGIIVLWYFVIPPIRALLNIGMKAITYYVVIHYLANQILGVPFHPEKSIRLLGAPFSRLRIIWAFIRWLNLGGIPFLLEQSGFMNATFSDSMFPKGPNDDPTHSGKQRRYPEVIQDVDDLRAPHYQSDFAGNPPSPPGHRGRFYDPFSTIEFPKYTGGDGVDKIKNENSE